MPVCITSSARSVDSRTPARAVSLALSLASWWLFLAICASSMTGDVASPPSNSELGELIGEAHRAHGLFVLVPCSCGQQTNVRPEDRFHAVTTALFTAFVTKKRKRPKALW